MNPLYMVRRYRNDIPDRKKRLFESSRILDTSNAQMIENRYQGRLFFFSIGRAKVGSRDPATGTSSATAQAQVDKKAEKELDWTFLFTPSNIPGFMQIDQFKTLAALMASVSSGTKIEIDRINFTPTVSFGGADVVWETTQLVTKYLDSIECTNYAFDKGPEVEYSNNENLAHIYFSLKGMVFKKMGIANVALDAVYTEFDSSESGLCGVAINQIEFEEAHKPTTGDMNNDIEALEKKLRTEFGDILKEFVKKRIAKRS